MSNTEPSQELLATMNGVAVSALRDERTVVLEDMRWEIRSGDYWVVAGLHAAGKSDLLMTMAGLVPPARGEYRLFGEPMPIFDEERLASRLRLGLVFEGGQLFHQLTVGENVSLPLRYHRNLSLAEAHNELKPLLDWLGLASISESTAGALSRNWQRRVGLARALALKPDLLLLDNPLGGLDLPHTNWWLEILSDLSRGHAWMKNRPLTLVVTTADLRPWRGRARQFAVLRDGRFVPLGSWQQMESEGEERVRDILDRRFFGGERI